MKNKADDFSDLKFKLNIENILNNTKGKYIYFNDKKMFFANQDLLDKIQKNIYLIGLAWIFL
jgi:hypothetical protein